MNTENRGKSFYPPRLLPPRKIWHVFNKIFAIAFLVNLSFLLMTAVGLNIGKHPLFSWFQIPISPDQIDFIIQKFGDKDALFEIFIWLVVSTTIIFCVWFFKIKKIANTIIQAHPEHLLIIRGLVEKEIPYLEIDEIILKGKGLSSYFLIKLKNKKKIKISSAIERPDYVLDAILKRRPNLVSRRDYVDFRKLVLLSDHRMARLHEVIFGKYKWILSFHFIILPFTGLVSLYFFQSAKMEITSFVLYLMSSVKIVLVVILTFWLLFYTISNYTIESEAFARFRANFKDKMRNRTLESRVLNSVVSLISFMIIGTFVGIYFTDINRIELNLAGGDYNYLNLKKWQVSFLDARYNCLDCEHSLKEGDIVVFRKKGSFERKVGKVLGLGGKQVAWVPPAIEGNRMPASIQEFHLPPKTLAIQTGENGSQFEIIGTERIYGKHIDDKNFNFLDYFTKLTKNFKSSN